MNKKVIDQIKSIEGVKTVECTDNMAVVVFEPREPIYIDPETGDEFFEGDEFFWFYKNINFSITNDLVKDFYTKDVFEESLKTSKGYKSRIDCEIALAKYILNKYK